MRSVTADPVEGPRCSPTSTCCSSRCSAPLTISCLPISEESLEDARDGLGRARCFSDDAPLLYAELGLLTVAGRPREAARVARRLSELEPENFDVWRSVYALAAQRDPALAARALELNPVAERRLWARESDPMT
ncbi:MAG: hypothetical protein M3550_10620 [Actinomycetota bacterium]|nr:hypothetical protein [Actinomycetota bacterium]